MLVSRFRNLSRAADGGGPGPLLPRILAPIANRTRTRKLVILASIFTAVVLLLYTGTLGDSPLSDWSLEKLPFGFGKSASNPRGSTCSPSDYSNGTWAYRPYYTRKGPLTKGQSSTANNTTPSLEGPAADTDDRDPTGSAHKPTVEILKNMTNWGDALKFARFEGCASSREFWWHLAADRLEQWDRYPGATEWEWVPGGKCAEDGKGKAGLREWETEEVIRDLVEGGGWLLIGDSVTENHFFSLSCLLYPHVIAYPNYAKLNTFDRAWPQHLYLNPESPLLHDEKIVPGDINGGAGTNRRRKLQLPAGFNISVTPLVTFRRVDLLWSTEELEKMHKELHPEYYRNYSDPTSPSTWKLFGEEATWTMSPDEYLDIFTKPLPEGNYATMITSTAGHWTTFLFAGYHPSHEMKGVNDALTFGYDGLVPFFKEVMERWAEVIQNRLDQRTSRDRAAGLSRIQGNKVVRAPSAANSRKRDPKVLVRAYLPGHEDCHTFRAPWEEIKPFLWDWWNWAEIWRFNEVYKNLLSNTARYRDILYLAIDRPARLRPDAHSSSDCLHIMSGAGVLEGWSHYIWHFVTREV